MKLKSKYDVVILGAGHNGLVAAAYLARAGLSVLLLEKNDYIGGATTSQRVFPEFDACLSRYCQRLGAERATRARMRCMRRYRGVGELCMGWTRSLTGGPPHTRGT